MIRYSIALLIFFLCWSCSQPPDPIEDTAIEIIRDSFGVPHIYAPTDAQVAYGLAWAQCEDDFITLQEQMLAIRGRYGEVKGKEGIEVDFGIKFMGLREVVDAKFDEDVSEDFKKVLKGFVDGVNTYARHYPHRLLLKDLFPLHEKDLIMGYLMALVQMTGAANDLTRIMDGSIELALNQDLPTGSNAIAISKRLNPDGETLLAINSHQPLEGWYSWFEAHLVSDEGLNILGGTFPGGVSIFHGVNEHLGWAHTVNHADFSDVYKLTMHPDNPMQYKYDGQWLTLQEKKYTSWLKVWSFIKIPISQTIYQSVYGPTFETESGFYSWRYVANQDIKAAEQWYRMNKAQDLKSFLRALNIQGIPCMNVIYADKDDNILFLSNGRIPRRNPNYNWQGILPGDTSATFWSNEESFTIDYLPQILNPECGYVYNTNNTPFSSSGLECNPNEPYINSFLGYQGTGIENNRSTRLYELIASADSIDYQTFKKIKYDIQYPNKLTDPRMINLELMMDLDPEKYSEFSEEINVLSAWDRRMSLDSKEAPLFILMIRFLQVKLESEHRWKRGNHITASDVLHALRESKQYLNQHFPDQDLQLRDFQFHSRDGIELPIEGGPDVMAAIYSRSVEDGRYRAVAGESYIIMVRFVDGKPFLETVNAYGSNANPNDQASTNQMQLFVDKELKPMTLDLLAIKSSSGSSVTHPYITQ
ncbi:MAG: penicillin acylase family protein [Bacteroidia bacterium]|nr:penicillin acylase family protein [Bacteroidia bacterium]